MDYQRAAAGLLIIVLTGGAITFILFAGIVIYSCLIMIVGSIL